MQLRPYQNRVIADVMARYAAGAFGCLVVSPTGSGKTVIYAAITRELARAGQPVLIVEPTVELVGQTVDKLRLFGIERVGIIAAGHGDGYNPDPTALVQVCTVQTWRSRPRSVLRTPRLVIFDEAHLAAAESYRMVRERYPAPSTKYLGFTATPYRLDGAGFRDMADAIVAGPSITDLQRMGSLTAFRTRSIPLTEYSANMGTSREFARDKLAQAYMRRELVGHPIDHYLASDKAGKPAILFASSVKHGEELTKIARMAGIAADLVHGDMPTVDRIAVLGTPDKPGRLAKGEIQMVVNYGVLTAGFDYPPLEYCGVVRATASLSLWIQMAGRVLRPSAGKADALIDDFGGNARRHGNIGKSRIYTLDGKRPEAVDDPEGLGKDCPACYLVVESTDTTCPSCGYQFAAKATAAPRKPAKSDVVVHDGRLVEIDADAEQFALPIRLSAAAQKPAGDSRQRREANRSAASAFAAAHGRQA